MIDHLRRRARVGDQRGDAGQGADHHVAARLELGAVGDDNQVFGAGQKLGFGPGHQRVAFDDAQGRDRIAGHEHLRRREMLDRVFVEGGKDDPRLTVQFTSRQDDAVHRVGDEFLRDGEGICQDLHPVLAEILRQEPGGGAGIEDDGIAILAKAGGALGHGLLQLGIQGLAGVEGRGGQWGLA